MGLIETARTVGLGLAVILDSRLERLFHLDAHQPVEIAGAALHPFVLAIDEHLRCIATVFLGIALAIGIEHGDQEGIQSHLKIGKLGIHFPLLVRTHDLVQGHLVGAAGIVIGFAPTKLLGKGLELG